MRNIRFISLCAAITAFSYVGCKSNKIAPIPVYKNTKIYLDENSQPIEEEEYYKKWHSRSYAGWHYINEKNKRVAQLHTVVFSPYLVNYKILLGEIERMTGKDFNEGTTLILHYVYYNDFCSRFSSNHKTKERIKERKRIYDRFTKGLQNTEILVFFEEGILLENEPVSPTEYFYSDKDNYLRRTIFKNPTLCGSFAIIKPNGQTLVQNGERAHGIVKFLEPKQWNSFFQEELEK